MSDIGSYSAGLIFGSDTGNTEEVGDKIADALSEFGCAVEMIDVNGADSEKLESFEFLILGIPTWDFGGIQEDWEEFEADIEAANLEGKVIALYGLGDQFGYGDFFLDAMGWLYERVKDKGAHIIGFWPTDGYEFEESKALIGDGKRFCGLAVDEDQQFELSDQRITDWVSQLEKEIKQI